MKRECKVIAPEILLEEYRQLLAEEPKAENLPLLVSGSSMVPFLVGGRDRVFLSRLERPARRGDILLYRRDNGAYVLHRVYSAQENSLTMVGDAQQQLEPGIQPAQIIALVTGAERKGKLQKPGAFWWEFFARFWIRVVPLRRFLHGIYSKAKR